MPTVLPGPQLKCQPAGYVLVYLPSRMSRRKPITFAGGTP